MNSKNNSTLATILVIDDDKGIRQSMEMMLEYENYHILTASSGKEGLDLIKKNASDVIFLDIKMPRFDGIDVLKEMKVQGIITPAIIISGHGNIDTAIQTMKLGAFDFIEKPLERNRILLTLKNALAFSKLIKENREFRNKEYEKFKIVGDSTAIQNVKLLIGKAGPTEATVLITGESGTGKELVARAIHRNSTCADGPFVQVNCAAIPDDLIESELFGHEKGAFTGATTMQKGKFELANNGSIFLDEIADMSLKTQAKVLRVLQEKEYQRLGSSKVFTTKARILAATNKNLQNEISERRFREDLFFRLNVIPIHVPALKDRKQDIPQLVEYFTQDYCKKNGLPIKSFSSESLKLLSNYKWPGNIRELKNIVERMIILINKPAIDEDDLPILDASNLRKKMFPFNFQTLTLKPFKEQVERYYLIEKLKQFKWNVQKTAEAIETPRSNLYRKMEQYSISEEKDG